jgi:hypothetical protein
VLFARRPLLLILAMQSVVSLATLRNTAFQDEGLYLYAGRQIVRNWMGGPAPLDHYAFYFSGYPYVYPVIGGYLDRIGGLELARSFSLVCMLGVTAMVYAATKKLFDRPAAVFASAAYALTGVVLFLGRLATFDALCLFLIALATGIGVRSGTAKRPWTTLAIGPVLVTAMLAKYAAGLFVLPVLAVLACVSLSFLGWRAAILRLFLALSTFALSLGIAYLTIDERAFHALSGSTTDRETFLKAPRPDLFGHVLQMGGVVFAIALAGLVLLVTRKRLGTLAVILFVSSWLAPLYHIYMREPISLDKHIAYGLFFAAPLAGYALAWLSGYERPALSSNRGYWLGGVAVVLVILTLGLHQSHRLFDNWANTSQLSYALHTQLRDGSGRILTEDIEVARYDARDVTEEWQWSSFYYPYYVDAAGDELLGNQALGRAVKDRYYDFVELSFNYFPEQAYFLSGQMIQTRNYDLISTIPFVNAYGKGHFYLFRSALVPGQGNFTDLKQLRMNVWP